MAHYIVNEDGVVAEVIEENETVIKISAGDKVVRKKSLDYFHDTKELKKRFVKVNDHATYFLSEHGKYICILIKFVGYCDGILKFANGVYLNNRSIAKLFDISERNTIRILDKLVKVDVIHKHKLKNRNYYTFNPWIASRGKRVAIELYEEFKMSEWASKSADSLEFEQYLNGSDKDG